MATRTGWVFADSPNIVLPINPSEDNGSLAIEKEIAYAEVNREGKTIIFEQGTAMPKVNFSGFFYTQAEYDTFVAEVNKDLSVLTDDRGVIYNIVWESFVMQRKTSSKYPWKHTYELVGFVKSYIIP